MERNVLGLYCFILVFQLPGLQVTGIDIRADLLPNDPTVLEGEQLIMNCTLSKTEGGITSADLYLQYGTEEMAEEYISRPNNLTVQLNITARFEMSHGHMYCYARNYTKDGVIDTLDHQVMTVIRRPLTPEITGCIVENWKKMICSWTPSAAEQKKHTGLEVEQKLYWILRNHPCIAGDACEKHVSTCPHPQPASCTWIVPDPAFENNHFRKDQEYTMFLNANLSDVASGQQWIFDFQPIVVNSKYFVKPDPPSEFKVIEGEWSFTLMWKKISASTGRHMMEEVEIEQLSDPDIPPFTLQWIDKEGQAKRQRSWNVGGNHTHDGERIVRPFTDYRATIRSIPYFHAYEIDQDHGESRGFWSDPISITFKTLSDVPGKLPEGTVGLFRRVEISHSGQKSVDITIYWNHIPRMYTHGDMQSILVHYVTDPGLLSRRRRGTGENSAVCVCPSDSCLTVAYQADVRYVQLSNLAHDRTYYVYLEGRNNAGCNNSLKPTPVIIAKENKLVAAPENFVVRQNTSANFLQLSWEHADDNDLPENYTIYWCQVKTAEKFKACVGPLEWRKIDGAATEFTFTDLDLGVTYEFAISAEARLPAGPVSSGLLFAECVYNMAQGIKAPENFRYAPEAQQEPEVIKLLWSKAERCKDSAYIKSYEIIYWSVRRTDRENMSVTVQATEERYVLDDVEADVTYRVAIRSKSPWKQSHFISLDDYTVPKGPGGVERSTVIIVCVVGVFCFILVAFGFFSICRRCRKEIIKRNKLPDIILPEDNITAEHNGKYYGEDYEPMLSNLSSDHLDLQYTLNDPQLRELDNKLPLLNGNLSNGTDGLTVHYTASLRDSSDAGVVSTDSKVFIQPASSRHTSQPPSPIVVTDGAGPEPSGEGSPTAAVEHPRAGVTANPSPLSGGHLRAPGSKDGGSSASSDITPYSVVKEPSLRDDRISARQGNTANIISPPAEAPPSNGDTKKPEGILSELPSAVSPETAVPTRQVPVNHMPMNSAGYVTVPPVTVPPSTANQALSMGGKHVNGGSVLPNGSNNAPSDNNETRLQNGDEAKQERIDSQKANTFSSGTFPGEDISTAGPVCHEPGSDKPTSALVGKTRSRDIDRHITEDSVEAELEHEQLFTSDKEKSKTGALEKSSEQQTEDSLKNRDSVHDETNVKTLPRSGRAGEREPKDAADVNSNNTSNENNTSSLPDQNSTPSRNGNVSPVSAYTPHFAVKKSAPSPGLGYVTHDQIVPV